VSRSHRGLVVAAASQATGVRLGLTWWDYEDRCGESWKSSGKRRQHQSSIDIVHGQLSQDRRALKSLMGGEQLL
jgi:hypothetical protein